MSGLTLVRGEWLGERRIEMRVISRRQFLDNSVKGIATAGCLSAISSRLGADPLGLPPGFQVFPIIPALNQDFDGTLKQLAAVGYQQVEMCSPPGYEKYGMGAFIPMKSAEIRKHFTDAGLRCVSSHFQFRELTGNLDDRIAWSQDLGLQQMIISTFSLPSHATLDDWKRAAEQSNKIGETTRKAGMQLGLHNHAFELVKIDGVLVFDTLMGVFDRKLVKSQCQVANVVSAGLDPVEFLTKYPDGFVSLHLADQPIGGGRGQVALGKGTIDWPKVFAAAKIGGVKNYFVEIAMDPLKQSYPYLHSLKT
jgi:sugar phosphate isomerase/epimerase